MTRWTFAVVLAVYLVCMTAIAVWPDARTPPRVVIAPTRTTTVDAHTAVCVSPDGWRYRTSPDVARKYHLDCKGPTP